MRFLKPGVCLLVGLALCAVSTAARAETSEEAVVTVNTSRMDPSVGVCQSGAPLDDAPEAMLRFVNDCPIGERDLEALRGDDGPLREIRDAVGDATGELLALIVELQSMRYRPEHAMFGADRGGPKLSVSRAVARFYSVIEYNEASLGLNDLSLIRTAIQRLLEQSVEGSSPQLGRQMMGRVRFILARSTARCTQLAGSVGRAQARAASLLCEDLAVYGELAADFADLRSWVAYWNGYVAVVEWSRWQSDAPRRVAQGLRQSAVLSVRTALEEPARRGRERLVRTSGALLALSATSTRVETVELAREAAFELWHALSARDRPSLAPYLRL